MRTLGLLAAVLFALSLAPGPADAAPAPDYETALRDGGSIATTTDGGSHVVMALAERSNWTMSIRCEGDQSTRYKLCTSETCTPTRGNRLLEYNRTFDIDLVSSPSQDTHLGLKTDDAGTPYCVVLGPKR